MVHFVQSNIICKFEMVLFLLHNLQMNLLGLPMILLILLIFLYVFSRKGFFFIGDLYIVIMFGVIKFSVI